MAGHEVLPEADASALRGAAAARSHLRVAEDFIIIIIIEIFNITYLLLSLL